MKSRASVLRSAGAYGAANTPVNSVAPAVTGLTSLGAVSTCSTGTWSLSPAITYQWRRAGTAISGETAATHTIVAADQTKALDCVVMANKGGVQAVKVSNAVAIP